RSLRSALGMAKPGLTWLMVFEGKELVFYGDIEPQLRQFAAKYDTVKRSLHMDYAAYYACERLENNNEKTRTETNQELLDLIRPLIKGAKDEQRHEAGLERSQGCNGVAVQATPEPALGDQD